jgi:type I restriction enzyme S subunit
MYYIGSDAGKGEINKISKASAQASLSMSTIRKIAFTLPSLSEQQSIASYLDEKCAEIDALIDIKQSKIEELKEYKKSIIYEYVTGKKEVV